MLTSAEDTPTIVDDSPPTQAGDLISEFSSAFETANSQLQELRAHLKSLILPEVTSVPSQRPRFELPAPPVFNLQEKALRDKWLHYLTWEEKNPLKLELQSDAGKKEYIARMQSVYRRAVIPMRFYGEVW
jgi:cleavage stimulation factor subunit 3